VSDTRLSMHAAGRRCPDRLAASYQTRRGQPGKLPIRISRQTTGCSLKWLSIAMTGGKSDCLENIKEVLSIPLHRLPLQNPE